MDDYFDLMNILLNGKVSVALNDDEEETEAAYDNIRAHADLVDQLHETYQQKNAAYGDSFSKSVEKYGLVAALTRMSDKWNRLENLILNRDVDTGDEALRDTLLDLANYCIMTVMCLDDKEDD